MFLFSDRIVATGKSGHEREAWPVRRQIRKDLYGINLHHLRFFCCIYKQLSSCTFLGSWTVWRARSLRSLTSDLSRTTRTTLLTFRLSMFFSVSLHEVVSSLQQVSRKSPLVTASSAVKNIRFYDNVCFHKNLYVILHCHAFHKTTVLHAYLYPAVLFVRSQLRCIDISCFFYHRRCLIIQVCQLPLAGSSVTLCSVFTSAIFITVAALLFTCISFVTLVCFLVTLNSHKLFFYHRRCLIIQVCPLPCSCFV